MQRSNTLIAKLLFTWLRAKCKCSNVVRELKNDIALVLCKYSYMTLIDFHITHIAGCLSLSRLYLLSIQSNIKFIANKIVIIERKSTPSIIYFPDASYQLMPTF